MTKSDKSDKSETVSPLTLLSLGIIYNYCHHHFWIRFKFLNWRGFLLKDIRVYPLLFSERNGFVKVWFPCMWWALVVLKEPHGVIGA